MCETIPASIYYARHLRLPGFDEGRQARLRAARVLIVGVGGLGCPAALYLAGAGVGTLALCDADEVSATNLHRQPLFGVRDVGRRKVDVAAERLQSINPHVRIEPIDRFADAPLLAQWVPLFDLVIDGTDNFAAKYAIDDACATAGVPLVFGSIFQFEGQVSVFHHPTASRPRGLSYRDLFPGAPPAGLTQNCGEAGVIGVLPGIVGALQANEAIKLITGLGETASGRLLVFDALSASMHSLALCRRAPAPAQAEDGLAGEMSYDHLLERLRSADPPLLVDVRELVERQAACLGGVHMPLATLPRRLAELPADRDIVVYCQSGVRSAKAALYLRSVLPEARVFKLKGGLDTGAGPRCAP